MNRPTSPTGLRARPWLAGLVATALLLLCGFTAVVRADATAEGYALARCQVDLHGVQRRIRTVHSELLASFARIDEAGEAAGREPDGVQR